MKVLTVSFFCEVVVAIHALPIAIVVFWCLLHSASMTQCRKHGRKIPAAGHGVNNIAFQD